MIGLKRGVVELYEHERSWEENAVQTIVVLKNIFGDIATDIQHIGSTSIKTIQAKPIIDIAVAVKNMEDPINLIPQLQLAGFHFRHHEVTGDLLFVCGNFENNIRTHHVHVVKADSMEWINYINFRNYLNAFPEKAKEYEATKLALMNRFPTDRMAYTDGKSAFISLTLRKALLWSYLEKIVTIRIDRPLGSTHPKYKNMIYPVNYGYIPDAIGGDSEELDVYVLGVNQPLTEFTGKIIGIIHRENDMEDKLVAAPDGTIFTQEEIAKKVDFQEQYFKIRIEVLG